MGLITGYRYALLIKLHVQFNLTKMDQKDQNEGWIQYDILSIIYMLCVLCIGVTFTL